MATDAVEQKLEDKEPKKLPEPSAVDVEAVKSAEGAPHASPLETEAQPAFVHPVSPKTFRQRLRAAMHSKKFWLITIFSVFIIAAALWFIDPTRLWIVNALGLRAKLVITTISPSEGKQQSAKLKNVQITVNNQQFKTDQQGRIEINQPYGKARISAKKSGYADTARESNLDFDPFFHLLGGKATDDAARNVELTLTAVGLPVSFKAVDWLSGQPISAGEYLVGDLTIKPDDQGLIAFKAPAQDGDKVSVRTNFNGTFIDKTFELSTTSKEIATISFVPAGKHYFLSKRSGALSIYSSDLDGSNAAELIPGTGFETTNTAFTVSPSGKYGVLASSRDNIRSEKKVLQQRLYIVDLEKKLLTKVEEANYFNFLDWAGDKLVFEKLTDDMTFLKSVDVSSKKLADIDDKVGSDKKIVSLDQVVYTQSIPNLTGGFTTTVKRANLNDGTSKNLLEGAAAYSIRQPDFDKAVFQGQANNKWYEYNLNTGQFKEIAQPMTQSSQVFLGSPNADNTKRIMLDRIDGKFTITVKTTADGAEKRLYGASGLGGPIRWLGDVIIFRIVNDQETADYAVSIKGGNPKKISDITATLSTQGAVTDINLFRYY